jgi:vacuolar-type H+-ATPase subunit C/Vma6
VSATGSLAFANARVRALKSRLLGREGLERMARSGSARSDLDTLRDAGFRELVEWYRVVLTCYPFGQSLILALFRRHETENVKLAWRGIVRRHAASRWIRLWVPLDRMATIRSEDCRDCGSLESLVEALQGSPYAEIARAMRRAHVDDPLAAELGFDRWTSRAIADAADELPVRDARARDLALAVVGQRDVNVIRRAGRGGLTAEVLSGALGWLHKRLTSDELKTLSSWSPEQGPLWTALPRAWQRRHPPVADWDAWMRHWNARRRAICRRAFLDQPFSLAPAIALLLLKEDEVGALSARALGA